MIAAVVVLESVSHNDQSEEGEVEAWSSRETERTRGKGQVIPVNIAKTAEVLTVDGESLWGLWLWDFFNIVSPMVLHHLHPVWFWAWMEDEYIWEEKKVIYSQLERATIHKTILIVFK